MMETKQKILETSKEKNIAFIPMKTHAQTNLLASLLQQSQRHMPGEMYCYPLTTTQTPRCSHCPNPSPETSRDLSLLLPQKATTLRQKYTEKLLCKYTLEDLSWKSVSVHVQAWALCGERKRTRVAVGPSSSQGCLYTGWMSCQHFLSPLPHCPSACVPNQTNTHGKWHMTLWKFHLFIYTV